jgi:hypothetical protein
LHDGKRFGGTYWLPSRYGEYRQSSADEQLKRYVAQDSFDHNPEQDEQIQMLAIS